MSLLSTLRMYMRRTAKVREPTDIYSHSVALLDGGKLDLRSLRGHPTLIVNTASKCGYAPQFEGQTVYERYRTGLRAAGLELHQVSGGGGRASSRSLADEGGPRGSQDNRGARVGAAELSTATSAVAGSRARL